MPWRKSIRQQIGGPLHVLFDLFAPRPPRKVESVAGQHAPGSGKDWTTPAGSLNGQRYSTLKQITNQNVNNLQVAWTFSTGVLRGHEGAPLVIGDVMYVHAPFPNTVFALDLNNDGKILWKYEPKQDPNVIPVMCCDTVNRGLAYGDGKIFLHQADTTLVAIDAKTGKPVWSVKTDDPDQGRDRHRCAAGRQGQGLYRRLRRRVRRACLVRRVLHRRRQGSLARLFRRPGFRDQGRSAEDHRARQAGRADSSLKTWQGDQWKIGGGATWGWKSYDPRTNLIFYGSGNPSTWNPKQRPGDNKWSMTIWARDADTGMAKWVYQMTPHDEWDYDGVNEMVLIDQESAASRAICWCIPTATASPIRSTAIAASYWWRRNSTPR